MTEVSSPLTSRHTSVLYASVVAVAALLGSLAGVTVAWSQPDYSAGASLLVTGLTGPAGETDPSSVYVYSETQRYVEDRMESWAATVETAEIADAAAAELGLDPDAMRGEVAAVVRPTTGFIDVTVSGAPTAEEAVSRTAVVTRTISVQLPIIERIEGAALIDVAVAGTDAEAVDQRGRGVGMLAVLGGVLGLLLGWTAMSIARPGRWIAMMWPPTGRVAQEHRTAAEDRSIQFEVIGVLLAGQSVRGMAVIAVSAFGVLGYAFTGSSIPPFIAVLIAGIASVWDLRYAAFAVIVTGLAALQQSVNLVPIGPITPTVLEFALVVGLVATLARWRPDQPRGPFTPFVLGIIGALVLGALIGFGRGADIAPLADAGRAGMTIVAFFIIREAFRGRPQQLLAVLLVNAAASSVLVLVALPLGLDLLLTRDFTDGVITGTGVTDFARLSNPVIQLWTPLLIIMAAGLRRLRAQWVLFVPAVLHMAMSFNRSTWGPLIVVTVLIAALRGGVQAVLVRGVQVLSIGVIGFGLASSGLLGEAAKAISDRFLSLFGAFTVETSLSDRVAENALVIERIRQDPLFGVGLGQPYGPINVEYDELHDVLTAVPSFVLHNQYLLIWVTMGVAGLVAYGALGVRLTAYSWHLWHRLRGAAVVPIAAATGILVLAVQAVFQTNLFEPAFVITIAAMLALIELEGTRTDPARSTPGPDRRPIAERPEGRVTA